jgi:hypothetical protein
LTKKIAKKQKGYVYGVYDENYYRYKAEKDELRSHYPEEMVRKEWKEYFSKLMDLMHTSPDFQQWIWDNPLPYEGVHAEKRKKKEGDDKRKVRRYVKRKDYPTFVLLIDDVNTGREWNNLKEAEKELRLSKGTISSILNGHRRKMDNGYFFKFKEDLEEKA